MSNIMQNRKRVPLLVGTLLAAALIAGVFALVDRDETAGKIVEDNRFLLDTVVGIRLYGSTGQDALEEAFDLIDTYESRLSRHRDISEISTLNSAPAQSVTTVSPETFTVIQQAMEYSELTNGAFDPTVGPLVDLWDIGGEAAGVPDTGDLQETLALVDYQKVSIDPERFTVSFETAGMSLDLGGIAKGYIADVVAEALKAAGEEHILLNLGGNILVAGGKEQGEPFSIGMQDPYDDRGAYLGIFRLTDGSVVSSGIYERYFEEDGVRYHHILDTETGYPVSNELAAVTVVSDRSVDGDALSTSLFSLGLEQGAALAVTLPGVEAAFVTRDGKVYLTPGAAEIFEATSKKLEVTVLGGG